VGSSGGDPFHKFVDRDVVKMLIIFRRDPGGTEAGVVLAKSSKVGSSSQS
jgi:hypothetical protein